MRARRCKTWLSGSVKRTFKDGFSFAIGVRKHLRGELRVEILSAVDLDIVLSGFVVQGGSSIGWARGGFESLLLFEIQEDPRAKQLRPRIGDKVGFGGHRYRIEIGQLLKPGLDSQRQRDAENGKKAFG